MCMTLYNIIKVAAYFAKKYQMIAMLLKQKIIY